MMTSSALAHLNLHGVRSHIFHFAIDGYDDHNQTNDLFHHVWTSLSMSTKTPSAVVRWVTRHSHKTNSVLIHTCHCWNIVWIFHILPRKVCNVKCFFLEQVGISQVSDPSQWHLNNTKKKKPKQKKKKQNSDDIHVKIQDNIFDPSFGGNPIQFY